MDQREIGPALKVSQWWRIWYTRKGRPLDGYFQTSFTFLNNMHRDDHENSDRIDGDKHCNPGCCHEHALHTVSPEEVAGAVEDGKYESNNLAHGRKFSVQGLDCVEEVRILKDVLGPLVGGPNYLSFNVVRGELTILDTTRQVSDAEIIRLIAQTGMTARRLASSQNAEGKRESTWKSKAVIIAGCLYALALLWETLFQGKLQALWSHEIELHWGSRFLLLATIVTSGLTVIQKVWYSIRRVRLDMNTLMFVAVLGALLLDQWMEAATVAFLFALSLQLEAWSVFRARRAIDQLLQRDLNSIRVQDADGNEREVDATDVAIGTSFTVRPGERIGLDGKILEGQGEINEALVTGESFPVFKNRGDSVFAGTINGQASLTIISTRNADDTQLARIIRLVSEHQAKRGAYETWVEQFSRWYTPAVLVVAIFTVIARWGLFHEGIASAIYNGLALLVIACPCALVISTPVSVVAALSAAARNGILVKGGEALEKVCQITTWIFDKTGTLTFGMPEVVAVKALEQHTEVEVLTRFAAVASKSEHLLARAIIRYCEQKQIEIPRLDEFQSEPGKGAAGLWNGKTYRIGAPEYHAKFHSTVEPERQWAHWRESGYSIVVLSSDNHLCGAIALKDAIRPQAYSTLQALREHGARSIQLLSGDHQQAVAAVAKELGISTYHGGMLPNGKVEEVSRIRQAGSKVAMVGDGVNDAPALAAADLGIAMGAGTDVALETADVALIHNDLQSLVWLQSHSQRMLSIIRQNIAVAIGIKIFFALLALFGTATLWGAIAADLGASLLVIFNGLRLLRR